MLFISHKTEDKAIANEVRRRALEHGYSDKQIFLDSDPGSGIEAGAEWESRIYESLKHTRAMLVLCSPNWLKSQWCFVELGYAKAMAISVFPIVIEPCEVGSTLSTTQAVDLPQAADTATRDEAFERLWVALDARHLGPKDNLPWPPPGETDSCPFPGLMCFDEKHAPVYFGREQERDAVIQQLQKMRSSGVPRLLMIVGGSGSGKSSLLRAGVLPWLKHPTERNDWLVLPTLRYGETPNDDMTLLARLAEIFAAHFTPNHPRRPDWKDLRNKFESDDVEQAARDFIDVTVDLCQAQHTPLATTADGPTVLLPIDQFEELLTAVARPSAQKFLRFLRTLLSRSNGRLLVVGTMRSDYLDVYEPHAESLKPPFLELYRLPPFPWERVGEVIVKPAERIDVTFTEELITRLKVDAPTSDALPLLAFTLEKLFRQCANDQVIELHEYEHLGGITGAISQAVARILPQDLPNETEQALRQSFLNHLAQVNEKDEFVRRRALWDTLPAAAKPLLEGFVRRERLLQRSGNKGEFVEVTHEALFRCWDQLKKWLQDDVPALRLRRRIDVLAEEWQHSRNAANSHGDEGLLLTHAQLAALDEWMQQGDVSLPDRETTFVEASRKKRKSDEQLEIERLQRLADAERKKQLAESQRADDAVRFSKRLKLAVSGTTVVALVAIVLGIAAQRQHSVAMKQTDIARKSDEAKKKADQRTIEERGRLLHQASMADLAGGRKAWQEDFDSQQKGQRAITIGGKSKWHESIAYFARALKLEPANQRAAFWLHSTLLNSGREKADLPLHSLKHDSLVHRASFSPDGTKVVTASGGFGSPGYAQVWDVATGTTVGDRLGHDNWVTRASFSPDGTKVVTGEAGYKPTIWDAVTGRQLTTLPHGNVVKETSFSPDGTMDVTAIWGMLQVWEVASGKSMPSLNYYGAIKDASPDGAKLVSVSSYSATVWDVATGQFLPTTLDHEGEVTSASFSPDGTRIVTTSVDKTARVWVAATGQRLATVEHMGGVMSASFSPDGTTIVTASDDGTARIWEVDSGEALAELIGHEGKVLSAKFSLDGAKVVTASEDKTARVWKMPTQQRFARRQSFEEKAKRLFEQLEPIGEPLRHEAKVEDASFSPDALMVVTASYDQFARVWQVASGQYAGLPLRLEHKIPPNAGDADAIPARVAQPVSSENKNLIALFSPDHKFTAVVTGEDIIVRDDADGGQLLGEGIHHPVWREPNEFRNLMAPDVSQDGTKVVTADGKFAQVWTVVTGKTLGPRLPHLDPVYYGRFSPDGTKVLTASGTPLDDGYSQVWEVPNGQRLGKPHPHKGNINNAAFSPDGLLVITVNNDRYSYYVEVWDVKTGDPIGEPMRHKKAIETVTFSPDGTMVVTASWDKTARIWDVATGQPLGEPLWHEGQVRSVSFSPDRSMIGIESDGEILRVWEVATEKDLAQVSPEILDWAQAITGLRFTDEGALQVISEDERRKVLEETELPPGLWAELGAWLKTKGPQRTLSPKSKVTLRQVAERERDFGSRASLESALMFDPNVPLARMMLSNLMEQEELAKEEGQRDKAVLARAAHWRRYDLDHLPDGDAKLWARAAEILRQLPEAQVGVGPKPIKAADEADKAEQMAIKVQSR